MLEKVSKVEFNTNIKPSPRPKISNGIGPGKSLTLSSAYFTYQITVLMKISKSINTIDVLMKLGLFDQCV